MKHPFEGILEDAVEERSENRKLSKHKLGKLIYMVFLGTELLRSMASIAAPGEEDSVSAATGEEGGRFRDTPIVTSMELTEEGGRKPEKEKGPGITSMALNEEGGRKPKKEEPGLITSMELTEEGGRKPKEEKGPRITSQAIGEEGGRKPKKEEPGLITSMELNEEGGRKPKKEDGPGFKTMMVGEDGCNDNFGKLE